MEGHVENPKPLSLATAAIAVAATTLPAVGCAAELGRPRGYRCLPRAGALVGVDPSVGGFAREAVPASGAAWPGGRPYEVFARGSSGHRGSSGRRRRCPAVPLLVGPTPAGGWVLLAGAAATSAAALWCVTPQEQRPQAPLPCGASAHGSNTRKHRCCVRAQCPRAGAWPHASCLAAAAASGLLAHRCATICDGSEGSNSCCPFSLLRQRF
ncbi:uncharacterized protein LOC135677429 [Musa acuminata AAA Group]|uniref:uncharacterized protein LOC135677429 n=1 Tax=Musa acuminata AAA Group TaxID=214697 RepID=UPI0031D738F5